jgi:endonuclease/exonuclease/phosphatase family metal-dependent hydrolase
MRALPDAIVSHNPDLILLQELWEREHALALQAALEKRGYPYARHWAHSSRGDTGLFIASKWPLTPLAFQSFRLGRLPHSFWHLDWMVSKGVASAWLDTPAGRVLVEDTHLQAQYVTDSYEGERLSQAFELVLMNRRRPDEPLILAGDFNSGAGESPRRALADWGELEDAHATSSEDTVYVRDGRRLAERVLAARAVLGEPRLLDDGSRMPLSDHLAIRVDLEVFSCENCSVARAGSDSGRALTLATLGRAAEVTRGRVAAALVASLGALGLASFWRQRLARVAPRSRCCLVLFRSGFALLVIGFAWSFYLGTVYYPLRGHALRLIVRELAR